MSLFKCTAGDYLPERLPGSPRRERVTVSAFGGEASLNGGGRVEDMVNMSPRRAPALATRLLRGMLMPLVGKGEAHGMAAFDGKLYFVRGTVLYCLTADAVVSVGSVSDTDKRFFVFGDCLYLFPDKLYLKAGEAELRPMEIDSGVLDVCKFREHDITLPEGMSWTGLGFAVGDCLRVVNADTNIPAPEGDFLIEELRGRVATVSENFSVTYESRARLLRVIPDLERVCVSGNRVYGIAGRDIYVSAAGNAMNFFSRGAENGSDGAVIRLDSDGDLTACAAWQGYVVFFKADRICKLLGTRSDSFSIQDRPAVGLSASMADTLCEVSGALYYLTESGAYRYRGQEPERISEPGEIGFSGGCGGTDGYAYYVAVCRSDGARRQYCYLPATGEWYGEDGLHPVCMIRYREFLCIQDADGYLWLTSSDGRRTGCLYDERRTGKIPASSVVLPPDYGLQPAGSRLTYVFIRASAEEDGRLEVMADYAIGAVGKDADGSDAVSLGVFYGGMKDRLLRIPVHAPVSDGVRLRLIMEGDWVIHSVTREYERIGK